MDYRTIKAMAREVGVSVADLCALATNNDPFYTGRPSEVAAARWFAGLWQRFGYERGHLRRVHYQIVSQDPPVRRPNGELYENTERDWNYLCNAGKWARYLGLVDARVFVDRRNPDAVVNARYGETYEPAYDLTDPWGGYEVYAPEFPPLPSFEVLGYEGNLQAYHLELWVEKTTMNDVLEPLCERYGVNLVTGAGEMSITAVMDFLDRVRVAGRPAVILYVSDYDPAGLGMPISVARKIEFYVRNGYGDLDVELRPVVLVADQVAEYDLPRVPVKDDRRKDNWIASHGVGQVELDALEALHPGELAQIVQDAILEYIDPDVERAAYEQHREVLAFLKSAGAEALEDLQPELERLQEEFEAAVKAFQTAVAGVTERLPSLHEEIMKRLEAVDIDWDQFPVPEAEVSPGALSLYSSGREYFQQLELYKRYRIGE